MTFTPTDLRMILSHLTNREGTIRPGEWTAEMKLALVSKVEKMIENGEK